VTNLRGEIMFIYTLNITQWVLPIGLGILLGAVIAYKRGSENLKITYLEPEDFRSNMRKGQLIDIRIKEDYDLEKINGSRNFPKKELLRNLYKLRKDQAVFLYHDDDRGLVKTIGNKLLKKGYRPVYVLKGGFKNWPFPKK
jgi:rhodanese-related sulfurtransferase